MLVCSTTDEYLFQGNNLAQHREHVLGYCICHVTMTLQITLKKIGPYMYFRLELNSSSVLQFEFPSLFCRQNKSTKLLFCFQTNKPLVCLFICAENNGVIHNHNAGKFIPQFIRFNGALSIVNPFLTYKFGCVVTILLCNHQQCRWI